VPGLVDLDTSMKPDKPTVAVDVKRDAASDLGLNVGSITGTLRALVAGRRWADWRAADDQTYDVKVRLAPEARDNAADLARLAWSLGAMPTARRAWCAWARWPTCASALGPNQINRRDLNREIEITPTPAAAAPARCRPTSGRCWTATPLPPGYRYRFGGSTKDMQDSFGYAVSALALGVVFIYMILASQFRSFLQPLALMSSLPLTLIGVVLALLALALHAEHVLDHRRRHADGPGDQERHPAGRLRHPRPRRHGTRAHALLEAAKVRLRPILMTTLAMVFGMVPLAWR
jgi:HAE1 family hydrophobic/amphiphilic exporter-1